MENTQYFRPHENNFWQWEENSSVIAIPNESTIAYRELIVDIVEKLSPFGLPPFGALLLTIIATNPKAISSLETVEKIIAGHLEGGNFDYGPSSMAFLTTLTSVPEAFKIGKNRFLLFQAIFENCHNNLSATNAVQVFKLLHNKQADETMQPFNQKILYNDLKVLSLLNSKFPSLQTIIEKINGLPEIPEILELNDTDSGENDSTDLIENLIANNKTFHVGSLVKRIWSGLNIPVHSAIPSQQPLGGVSDLTNKGDFDKLLISEFANDDLVFLSRLANNEALYIQREIPPNDQEMERVILIDVSLKTWGTPKTIAFATMLAIAKHPKTNIACKIFTIGNNYEPVSIESPATILSGLQNLAVSLNCVSGLETYLKDNPANKKTEIFLITEPSTLRQSEMMKAINEHHLNINYWIYTDFQGNIDVYKKQQSSKKHLQHIKLPLEELWKDEIKPKSQHESSLLPVADFPVLFRNGRKPRAILSASDGAIFQVNSYRMVLKFYDNALNQYQKGWELICENIPVNSSDFEIGISETGEYILLLFNPQNKTVSLLNLNTKEINVILFKQWQPSGKMNFVFHENKFYHFKTNQTFTISLDGKVDETALDFTIFSDRIKEIEKLSKEYSATLNVFKNINSVFINHLNNLVFNIHELRLENPDYLEFRKSKMLTEIISAKKNGNQLFEFDDGSEVEINLAGVIILKSSNIEIPYIYIPSVVSSRIGAMASNDFSGNEYYLKQHNSTIRKIKADLFFKNYIEKFINHIQAHGNQS